MLTLREIGPDGQPFTLYEVTLTVPVPAVQFTFMLLDPCPEVMLPPVTTQVKVVPLVAGTLYVPEAPAHKGLGPVMIVGPT